MCGCVRVPLDHPGCKALQARLALKALADHQHQTQVDLHIYKIYQCLQIHKHITSRAQVTSSSKHGNRPRQFRELLFPTVHGRYSREHRPPPAILSGVKRCRFIVVKNCEIIFPVLLRTDGKVACYAQKQATSADSVMTLQAIHSVINLSPFVSLRRFSLFFSPLKFSQKNEPRFHKTLFR